MCIKCPYWQGSTGNAPVVEKVENSLPHNYVMDIFTSYAVFRNGNPQKTLEEMATYRSKCSISHIVYKLDLTRVNPLPDKGSFWHIWKKQVIKKLSPKSLWQTYMKWTVECTFKLLWSKSLGLHFLHVSGRPFSHTGICMTITWDAKNMMIICVRC